MGKLTKHHLRPRSRGGDDSPENISYVPDLHHRSWHMLFSNLLAPVICEIINQKWLDGRYKFICVESDKYERAKKLLKGIT